jgi:hypothetical protein
MTDQMELCFDAPRPPVTKADKQRQRLADLKRRYGRRTVAEALPANVVSLSDARKAKAEAECAKAADRARFFAWYSGDADRFA